MRKWIFMAAAAALALSLAACGTGAASKDSSAPSKTDEPSAASDVSGVEQNGESDGLFATFTGTDLAGNAVDESVLEGKKITMINVWATFCGPCLSEMPDLGELNKAYADKGVQVVGIVSDVFDRKGLADAEMVALAQKLAEETGADYLHVVPSADLMSGVLSDVSAVPTTFFVDEAGNLLAEPYLGARSRADWEKVIDSLLSAVQ